MYITVRARLAWALVAASLASAILYAVGRWGVYQHDFAYMLWNLFLAWIPFLITLWLDRILYRSLWSSWYALAVTLLWIIFLPNTFYMVTDLIHVNALDNANLVQGVVMLTSFIFLGIILGFLSVYIVHNALRRRVRERTAFVLIELVFLLCSFAIYVGRELRWNTWDLVVNPMAVLFDTTDRLLNPIQHPRAYTITLSFFLFLSSMYAVVWYAMRAARQQRD